jgi:probable F420-dependent oxidoreductase
MSLRVGFGLITAQVPPGATHSVTEEYQDTLALARLAEDVGFDALWVSEHHFAADSYLPSPTVLLGALAAVTERVQLGTAIALAPLQHPLRFAEDCAVLDQISGGRLVVGLGAGWRREEFAAFGVPTAERGRRTAELVRTCRAAWAPGRLTPQGALGPDGGVPVTPKPAGTIPLLLGGTAPAAIRRAAQLGDGYLGSPQNDLDAFRRAVAMFAEAARQAGRDPATLSLGLHVNAWVSPDGEIGAPVLAAMWHQIATYMAWHAVDDGGPAATGLAPLDLTRLSARTISGTPDSVAARSRPWIEEFADRELHMIFRLHYPGMRYAQAEPAIRTFAAEVIPQLRAYVPAPQRR